MVFYSSNSLTLAEHGIAIGLTHGGLGGGHVGIFFNETGEQPRLLHLLWHQTLRVDTLPARGCWIVTTLDIPPVAAKHLSAQIRAISRKLPKINYGIDFIASKGSFQGTKYSAPKGSNGLTCASFVLEVLSAGAVPLIQDQTWQPSAANTEWGDKVCAELLETTGDAKHVAAVRKSYNDLRLVPFELAAAAALPQDQRPVDFATIQVLAAQAKAALETACPVMPQRIA